MPSDGARGLVGVFVRSAQIAFVAAIALAEPSPADVADVGLPGVEEISARIDSLHAARLVGEAAAYAEPLLDRTRIAGDPELLLVLTGKLGRLWAAFGQPDRGAPLLMEAIELATSRRDTLRLCDGLRWLGFARNQQGRAEESSAIYSRMLAAATASHDVRHEAWARVGLGYQASRTVEQEEAAIQYSRAVELFREIGDRGAEIWALNGLGTAMQGLGRDDEAAAIYELVAATAHEVGYLAVEALAWNNIGTLEFARGDPGDALANFERAEALHRELSQWAGYITTASNVARCQTYLGRVDEAAARLQELVRFCGEMGFAAEVAELSAQLAGVRQMQDRPREAAELYRSVLADGGEIMQLKTHVEASIGLASALFAADSSAAALDVIESTRARWAGDLHGELRLELHLAHGEHLHSAGRSEEAAAVLARVAGGAQEAGLPRQQLAARAWQARALRALGRPQAARGAAREAAELWETIRGSSRSREWRELRGSSSKWIASQLAALLLAEPGDSAVARAYDAVRGFKARSLAEHMDAAGTAATAQESLPTLERVQSELLRDGELLLDYLVGPDESILFAVTKSRALAVLLPGEKRLEARLHLTRDMLAAPPGAAREAPARLLADLRRLGDSLFGPAAALVAGASHVIVVPDGALNLIPFSQLDEPHSGRRWSRIPAASVLAAVRFRSRAATGSGILALAGSENDRGERLAGAEAETRSLARRYRGVDTAVDGIEQLSRYDLLHFASHARVDDQRPWSSELWLDRSGAAGSLRADRIASLPLTARLAVLSACSTGSGRVLSGEGVLGLSGAFLEAGVTAVVASLWAVDDRVTLRIMEGFYEGLADCLPVSEALAAAQARIRSRVETSHPFFWAGFVVVGDGEITIPIERRRRTWLPWLPLLALVLVAGSALALRIRAARRVFPPAL